MWTSKRDEHITVETNPIENYIMEGRTLAYMARKLELGATSISRELRRSRRYKGNATPPGETATNTRTAQPARSA